MSEFKPIKTISDKLNSIPIQEGQFICTVDNGKIYIDIDSLNRLECGKSNEYPQITYYNTNSNPLPSNAIETYYSSTIEYNIIIEEYKNYIKIKGTFNTIVENPNDMIMGGYLYIPELQKNIDEWQPSHAFNEYIPIVYTRYISNTNSSYRSKRKRNRLFTKFFNIFL